MDGTSELACREGGALRLRRARVGMRFGERNQERRAGAGSCAEARQALRLLGDNQGRQLGHAAQVAVSGLDDLRGGLRRKRQVDVRRYGPSRCCRQVGGLDQGGRSDARDSRGCVKGVLQGNCEAVRLRARRGRQHVPCRTRDDCGRGCVPARLSPRIDGRQCALLGVDKRGCA